MQRSTLFGPGFMCHKVICNGSVELVSLMKKTQFLPLILSGLGCRRLFSKVFTLENHANGGS